MNSSADTELSLQRLVPADPDPNRAFALRSGVRARGTLGCGPEILLHPREEARRAVDEEARPGEDVIFARIHDELGLNAERSQRLIHLLTAGDRHVEILIPTEEQRRCVD